MRLKEKHFIDIHKGITGIFMLLLMYIYGTWDSVTSWVYLAIHGTYGILWIAKSILFPDATWERETSIWYGLYIWFGLTLYWASGWIINSGYFNDGIPQDAPMWIIGLSISMFGIGVFLHFSSDMYKHTMLNQRPGKLIDSGIMSSCRNINYFGELIIYLSFAILSMHWLPFVVLALMIAIVWAPNMIKKDRSLSRYPDFDKYKKKSKLFIPYVF
ncbi:MAG: hypothetical protein CBD77_04800 [bacterium TMED217]|nr:MAG: hypothetical protein CBD77_04800 [bacterium TMED217]